MNNKCKLTKGTPNQKRKVPTTLSSLAASNSHIDLIAFFYEVLTETEPDYTIDDTEEGLIIPDLILSHEEIVLSINKQFGLEKELEIYKFIHYLKDCYVTDLRGEKNKIASKRTLLYFDDKETIISELFDSELIFTELQVFFVEPEFLKNIKEVFKVGNQDTM